MLDGRAALIAVLLAACSGGGGAPAKPPIVWDAAVPDAAPPAPPPVDDTTLARPTGPATHEHRVLALMLQSTPSGAIASVDGHDVGRTPVYWEGEFTGREREFSFRMQDYTTATYHFVPIRDGFVHGKLDPALDDDGGVPAVAPYVPPLAIDAAPPAPVVHHAPPPPAPDAASSPPPGVTDAAAAPALDAAPPPAPVLDAGQGTL